jgi:predicted RNase H-like HicB family nuclease
LQRDSQSRRFESKVRRGIVIDLKYSLVIEATDDPTFFGFYSPDLEGFTGIGHSIEDCLYQARWGMKEHLELLKEQSLPIPKENAEPKIVIQNQEPLAQAS